MENSTSTTPKINQASTTIDAHFIQTHMEQFVDALQPVYEEFGSTNADVAFLMAEALLQLTPWNLYPTTNSNGTTMSNHHKHVDDIQEVLGRALTVNPNHPGANHLLIHCCEMSPTPQQALSACTRLSSSTAAACCPHLLHMPSHIYLLLGRYRDAVEANRRAIEFDRQLYQYEDETHSYPQQHRIIGTDFYTGYVRRNSSNTVQFCRSVVRYQCCSWSLLVSQRSYIIGWS